MYILDQDKKRVHRDSAIERFDALYQLYCALASGESFEMPQSLKIEPVKHDARTRRRGGS